jgi:hypothetical protein
MTFGPAGNGVRVHADREGIRAPEVFKQAPDNTIHQMTNLKDDRKTRR